MAATGRSAGSGQRGRVERASYLISAALSAPACSTWVVFAVDGGPWYGPVSWRKPTQFGLSFGLTLATVAWSRRYLPLRDRTRRLLLGVFALDCCVEVAGITLQAWRHVPRTSTGTPFDSAVSTVLAGGRRGLVVVLGALAAGAFRARVAPACGFALRAGFGTLMIGPRVRGGDDRPWGRRGQRRSSASGLRGSGFSAAPRGEPAWRAGAARPGLAACRGPAGTRPRAPRAVAVASRVRPGIIRLLAYSLAEVPQTDRIVVPVVSESTHRHQTSRDGGQCTVDLPQGGGGKP